MVQGQETFGIGGGLLPVHASNAGPTSGPRRGVVLSAREEEGNISPSPRSRYGKGRTQSLRSSTISFLASLPSAIVTWAKWSS